MRYLVLLFICLFNTEFSFAQEDNNLLYYVWAKSGLSLRNAPNKTAEKLTIIPYSDNVTFIAKTAETYTIIEFPGFEYSDGWVEVNYKNLTGYVFAGYLSHMQPPNISTDTSLTSYLDKLFTETQTIAYETYENCKNDNRLSCIKSGQKSYKSGVTYTFWNGEGGGTEDLSIPNKLNILQAFTLGTIFCPSYKDFDVVYYEKPQPTIIVERDDVGCDFTITVLGDFTIIRWSGGC